MTARLIAPCHPPVWPSGRPGARQDGCGPPPACRCRAGDPAVPDDVRYGLGRIDESGRVADRTITSALGWHAGDRLTLTAAAGVVIARRDTGGMVTMPARPYIAIPAA